MFLLIYDECLGFIDQTTDKRKVKSSIDAPHSTPGFYNGCAVVDSRYFRPTTQHCEVFFSGLLEDLVERAEGSCRP